VAVKIFAAWKRVLSGKEEREWEDWRDVVHQLLNTSQSNLRIKEKHHRVGVATTSPKKC